MLHFDNKLLKLLKYIKRHDGVSYEKLATVFDDDFLQLLIPLTQEDYISTQDESGNFQFYKTEPYHIGCKFTYCTTLKGNELVEKRIFNFRKWIIPTIISVLSLALSIVTLLLSIYGNNTISVTLIK